MEEKKTDRRIKRTKAMLREALMKLMQEKPIGKITPSELCREAGINRNTFYTYYSSPAELLLSIEMELLENFSDSYDMLMNGIHTRKALIGILETMRKYSDLCMITLSDRGDDAFYVQVLNMARDSVYELWKSQNFSGTDDDFDLLYSFISEGCISAIRHWLKSGCRKTPAQVEAFIEKAFLYGIATYIPNALRIME